MADMRLAITSGQAASSNDPIPVQGLHHVCCVTERTLFQDAWQAFSHEWRACTRGHLHHSMGLCLVGGAARAAGVLRAAAHIQAQQRGQPGQQGSPVSSCAPVQQAAPIEAVVADGCYAGMAPAGTMRSESPGLP